MKQNENTFHPHMYLFRKANFATWVQNIYLANIHTWFLLQIVNIKSHGGQMQISFIFFDFVHLEIKTDNKPQFLYSRVSQCDNIRATRQYWIGFVTYYSWSMQEKFHFKYRFTQSRSDYCLRMIIASIVRKPSSWITTVWRIKISILQGHPKRATANAGQSSYNGL